nr:Uncharacterised protein [Klebsiella pneumoniae]
MGIYVAPGHPLAAQGKVARDELRSWRELRLSTFLASATEPAAGQVWSAPNYLLLLSMAAQGSAGAFCPARWWRSLRRRAGWWRSISPAGRGQFQSICCGIRKRRRERPAAGCVSICSGVNVNE